MRTSEGSLIRGVIKNEDTFSLRMMDEQEKLHLLSKAAVKEIARPQRLLMSAPPPISTTSSPS